MYDRVNRRTAIIAFVAALAAVVLLLVICIPRGRPVAYRPVSMGEVQNGIGMCYYDDYPGVDFMSQVQAYQRDRLCDPTWIPTPMPVYFHSRYFSFLRSEAFYTRYVPRQQINVFVNNEKTYLSANGSSIRAEASKGVFKGSNGKTVTAEKIGVAKFGAGDSFGSAGKKFGSGDSFTKTTTTNTKTTNNTTTRNDTTTNKIAPAPGKAPDPAIGRPAPAPARPAPAPAYKPAPAPAYRPAPAPAYRPAPAPAYRAPAPPSFRR